MNSLQRRARFDAVIEEFNGERPHQAPGLRCPAELYTPFTRPYRGLSRRRHLARPLHALRSWICRFGTEDPAAPRQPVRPEVVTHVLGTICYLCRRAGHTCGLAHPTGFEPV